MFDVENYLVWHVLILALQDVSRIFEMTIKSMCLLIKLNVRVLQENKANKDVLILHLSEIIFFGEMLFLENIRKT